MQQLKSFPRNSRLVCKAQFQAIFDESSRISQKYLLALYKPNQIKHARLGIMVGKRVANLAVGRNQIKRVIRESFRAHQMELQGLDILIIARQQCDSLDKLQLRKGIETLWQKLVMQSQKS
jgi:ribonuclease P protein component